MIKVGSAIASSIRAFWWPVNRKTGLTIGASSAILRDSDPPIIMALKYFEPQNRSTNYGTQGGFVKDFYTYTPLGAGERPQEMTQLGGVPKGVGGPYIGPPPATYETTGNKSWTGPDGRVLSTPTYSRVEQKGFYSYDKEGRPIGWTSFEEQAKRNQERSMFNREMQREQKEAAEAKFKTGQELDSRGFSRNFLEYLQGARERKLSQASADIAKTGAETGLLGAQSELASAQSGRITQMTPFEIQQMVAQSKLFGAQAGKLGAETASELGMTGPSQMAMRLSQAQIGKLGAETASEWGETPTSRANIGLLQSQSSKYAGDTNWRNAMMGSPYFGSGATVQQSVVPPPKKKKLGNYWVTY